MLLICYHNAPSPFFWECEILSFLRYDMIQSQHHLIKSSQITGCLIIWTSHFQIDLFDHHASEVTALLLKVYEKVNDSQPVSPRLLFFRETLYSGNASRLTFQSVTRAYTDQNLLQWLIACKSACRRENSCRPSRQPSPLPPAYRQTQKLWFNHSYIKTQIFPFTLMHRIGLYLSITYLPYWNNVFIPYMHCTSALKWALMWSCSRKK